MRKKRGKWGRKAAALVLAAGLLAGCAQPRAEQGSGSVLPTQPPAATAAPEPPAEREEPYGGQAAGGAGKSGVYGSVGLISFPSVLVSVYLDETDGAAWTEEEIERSRANLALAVEWIGEQCAAYNAAPKITYDDGGHDDLCLRVDYEGTIRGGVDSDEGRDFYDAVDDFCAENDTEALEQAYGTANIGFLIFLPAAGSAFTTVHYQEDGPYYYYEYCCLYRDDAYSGPGTFDSPAVYAHEILHLYGAPDLYRGSSDTFVTEELSSYVEQCWPDAIMLGIYEEDDSIRYDVIDKMLSPVTAYRLGLCDTFAGIEAFPAIRDTAPGVFSEQAEQTSETPWSAAESSAVAA